MWNELFFAANEMNGYNEGEFNFVNVLVCILSIFIIKRCYFFNIICRWKS